MAAQRFENTRVRQLFEALPWTPENRLTLARAFLDEEGDIPQEVEYGFVREARNADEAEAIRKSMRELREQHFAKLGKPVPNDRPFLR
jgi:hypothetical protein